MKKQITISCLFILFFVTSIFAGAILIDDPKAESDDENIIVKWTTGEETNLDHFLVLRKSMNGTFGVVSNEIKAKGSNSSYEFKDQNAYKTSDVLYQYKIKIVEKNGETSESSTISVHHSVSSVKKTWGSIKALFR